MRCGTWIKLSSNSDIFVLFFPRLVFRQPPIWSTKFHSLWILLNSPMARCVSRSTRWSSALNSLCRWSPMRRRRSAQLWSRGTCSVFSMAFQRRRLVLHVVSTTSIGHSSRLDRRWELWCTRMCSRRDVMTLLASWLWWVGHVLR